MFKFILSLLYIFVHSILVSSPDVTPTDYDSSKYLSRYFSDDEKDRQIESCRYYSADSTISFNGDKVFSPDYEKLNTEIKMHVKALESPSNLSGYKVTFMSIILSATGKNQSGKIKRVYDKIYVKEEDDGTPTILTDQEKGSKILVFSSNNSDYFKYKDFRKNSTTFSKNGAYELFNLSSFEGKDNHDIKSKYNEFYKNKNNSSHAEPLWLATLLTLPQDTFQQLLPGYTLMYYEIHFLSNYDACSDCSRLVRNEATKLKERFGSNLFIFYHSWYPYINNYYSPYRIKFRQTENETNWIIVQASFSFKDYNLKVHDDNEDKGDESSCKKLLKQKTQVLSIRGDTNLAKFPSFYIGIIHQYEGREIEIIE